jgi:hypothetical protein
MVADDRNGFYGGLVAGFAALSGSYLRSTSPKK